ncbi:hypothetical protein MJ581_11400 [Escherichia coli]|nr:hypothetical protein MJ581_11400 [Escherichia coli]
MTTLLQENAADYEFSSLAPLAMLMLPGKVTFKNGSKMGEDYATPKTGGPSYIRTEEELVGERRRCFHDIQPC